MSTTVSLMATVAADEGGTITYTASVGAIPVLSDVTVSLDNGQTITILAGETSGAVTVIVPADVYAASPGAQAAAIASVAGTGGFDSLLFDPAPVSAAVNQVTDVTTVSLTATAVVAEGGAITYTASVGANPALSDVTVALDNGHTITIAAGRTSGTVTVLVPADVTSATPGGQAAAIAGITGDGGFESLEFNPAQVSTAILSSAVLAVNEADAPITTGGQLTITDTASVTTFVAQTATAGTHGIFSIDTSGAWTYTANSAFDSLNAGDSVSDTFIVASADGTTTTVQVTINGTNDAAVLSSATLALDETNAPLATAGTLTVSDVDSPATFVAQTDTAGAHGSFSIDTTGAWTYTANSAFDSLNAGDSVSDTFTVASADGTTTTVQVTINGTNDAAVLSSATVALEETNAPLATAGTLTVSDVDSPATFVAQTDTAGAHGIFSIDTTGAWTYTANSAFDSLNAGDSVSDTFTVASADGTTTTVQVTINGTNDAAVLSSATLALEETNAPLATAGTLTVSDVDSPATFVAQTDTAGAHGSFSIDTTGAWTYTANSAFDSLNAGDSVSDTFTVAGADGTTTTVQVTINGTNDAAVISSATVALEETNAPLATAGTLTVSDVDSPATFVAQTDTAGAHGSFSIDTTGAWTYAANSAFDSLNAGDSVSDTFTVASADGTTTTVQVTVNGTNDAAVLSSATLALDETNAPLATAGTLTVSDVDSPATFVAQTDTAGAHGSFSIDTTGAWTYTANSAFDSLNAGDSVSDTFTVASADGTTTTVQVTINGTNDAAVLSSATLALDETNAPLATAGTLTVSDVDSPATFVAQTDTAGAHGSFSIDTTGAWTYTANSAFDSLNAGDSVSDTFTVASADGTTTTVQVTINGTNDAAVLSSATLALDESNAPLATAGTLTVSDVDSPATFVAQTDTAGAHGSFSIDTTGAWTYTANSAFDSLNAGDSVSDTFIVASADGTTTTVQVTINGTNDAAVLSSATLALDETNAPLATAGTLTVSDVDSPATFVAQTDTAGAHGSFSIDTTGAWTYTANSAFDSLNAGDSVSDTFIVASADGTTTTVQVTINGTNDAAVLSSATLALDESNAPLATAGTLTVSDVDSPATFVAQTDTAGAHGIFSIDTTGAWTYTANSAFDSLNAGDSVSDTFKVASADGTTTTVQVTINGTNDAAVISGISTVEVTEAGGLANAILGTPTATGTLTATDVDSTATFTPVAVAAPSTSGFGSFTMTAGGVWTYTLDNANPAVQALNTGGTLTDHFTVTTADGTAQVVTVTINGTNDAAVIGGTSTGAVVEAGGVLNSITGTPTASGTLTATDVDSAATFNAVVTPTASTGGFGTFTMTSGGVWTYALDNANLAVQGLNVNQTLTDHFTVTTADGTAQVVTVTINGNNDAAVILGTSAGAVTEAGGVANAIPGIPTATGTLSATDADSAATFNAVAVATPSTSGFGSFTMTAGGVWTYALDNANPAVQALNAGATLTDHFTVTTADGTAQVVTVTISGTNDAAVISGTSAGAVTEAGGVAGSIPGTPVATGTLTATDVDSAATFNAVAIATPSTSGFGTFTMTSGGVWTYTLNNANLAVQALNAGGTLTDRFTVTTADGTAQVVTVTINGTNDAAVISGTSAGAVTEAGGVANATPGTPTATGTLTDTDVDNPVNTFTPVAVATPSTSGFGSFTMTSGGVWTYTLNNANPAVQALNTGGTLTDHFTVTSADGTAQVVTVTINGTNDAAVISGTSAGAVTEAGGVANATPGTPTATGTLTDTDVDNPVNTFTPVAVATPSTSGFGSFTMTSGGVWTYTLNNANPAVQALNTGGTLTDHFTVTSADGTAQVMTVTINGTNDAAVIGGVSTGAVTEAGGVANAIPGTPTATGTLTASDVDSAATFTPVTVAAASTGGFGSFTMTPAGVWTYTLNNANPAVQALNVGGTLTDSFTVTTADGTAQVVKVTIAGTNDAAVIGGVSTGAVTEAGGVGNAIPGTPTATGTLTATDVDSAATFNAVATATTSAGGFGSFTMTSAGVWTYTLNNANPAVQALNAGGTLTDTFTVTTADGTAQVVTVTINGTNDAAVISGISTGTVTEAGGALNAIPGTPTATGTLTDTDVDNPINTFTAVLAPAAGTSGFGTFTMTAGGVWTYTLNNANPTVQALNTGGTLTDRFTVTTVDGTAQVVTVTINGTNDAAVIGGVSTGAVIEAGGVANAILGTPTASGTLTATDVDSAATFNAAATATASAGGFGSFTMTSAGVWTYALNNANPAVQALNAGGTLTDSFTVSTADGTAKVVTVTINGANDTATIIGASTGAVLEATNTLPGTPAASGTLTDTDVDNAANTFTAVAAPAASSGGFGTFTMTAGGVWTYTLDNANPAVQALNTGQTLTDTFTVRTVDGTAQVVTVTINGVTDAYSLTDTAANLADPLITPVALANGAFNITATTPATVAQAVAINAFTNSGVKSYSISDNAFFVANLANPAVTPPAVGQNATNIIVTTDATEAQAQSISLLVPHGTLTYNLVDQVQVLIAQTPAAIRAGNLATNITVGFSPSTGTIVTLAQAAIIDAFTNRGTNSYDLQDTAANLLAATASVLAGGHFINAIGTSTVAQAGSLLGLAVNAASVSYELRDTAANLALTPAAIASHAGTASASTPATVAQATAMQIFPALNGAGQAIRFYDMSDTAAALAAASAPVANGAGNITASTPATVAQATIIDAFTNELNGGINSYVLTDTAANLALASASVGSGAIVINASTAATVAQASVFTAFNDPQVNGGGVKNYSLSDTAANLALASALVGNGAANISASTPATVAQANAIDAFTNTGVNSYALADTAANLAAATALVGHNASNIVATTAATVAQANAIDAFTNSGKNSFSLADTAANLAAALPAVANQASDITTTDGATVAQANTIDAFLNTGVNSYSLADSSVNLLAPAAAARVSAATVVTVTNAIPVANAVTLRALNAHTVYNLADTAANLAAAGAAVGNAATSITATTAASVAQAVTIDGYTNAGALSFNLSDSTANLIAAPAALTIGANTISISSVDALTVAGAAGKAAGTYALQDTAAALAAASAAVGNGATLINASTAVTAAQIDAIHAIVKPGVHTLLALSDSAANLAAKIGLADVAFADARSFNVTTAATVAQAHAIHGYNAISAKVGYAVADTAANLAGAITLLGGADPALASATSFTVTGAATVAQANAIHGYNAVSSLAAYLLADTAAALVAAPAATVHSASDLTVTDTLLATQAATLSTELGVPADPAHFHYTLSDTATNLAALPAALVSGHPVTIVGPASVAEAAILHTEAPAAAYGIVDAATNLATALTTGSISLAAVKFAGTIDVDGPAINASLTVNADQFHNMLVAGHPLLALNDTIALDGDVAANLGTLTDFGGNDAAGIVLGGGLNGSYTVNLGTSGDTTVTMAGTGHHDITAATGVKEAFVVGLISTGGSTLRNLESGEVIDTTTGNFGQGTKNNPSTQVATGALVTGPSQWAYETANHTLTWWDPTHSTAETLVLHFAAVGDAGGVTVKSTHSFTVI